MFQLREAYDRALSEVPSLLRGSHMPVLSFPEINGHLAIMSRSPGPRIKIVCAKKDCDVIIMWDPHQGGREVIERWKRAHFGA